eukprot:scaffold15792_cov141-Isochrysis_galbana.AAC.4
MPDGLNAAPELHAESDERRTQQDCATESDPEARDPIDALEIFGALPHAICLVGTSVLLTSDCHSCTCRTDPRDQGSRAPAHARTVECSTTPADRRG